MYGLAEENNVLWFSEYNFAAQVYQLKKMDLSTGAVTYVADLDLPDAMARFIVNNGYIFVISNTEYSQSSFLGIGISLLVIMVIIFRIKRK